jgi:hypothetical protein
MSAATFHANLRAAFRQRLLTQTGLPAQAWEGRPYQPVKGTPYVSESIRAISSVVRALGLGGTIAHTVTGNFTFHFPAGKGTNDVDSMAGSVMALFRPGTVLAYGGDSAVVQQAERSAVIQEPDWINVTVIITAVGHTAN